MTPDLVPPSSPPWPEFPLVSESTSLVLYPGARDELRARWSLSADDFVSYGTGFPSDGGRPEAILRLRRLCPGFDSETSHEIRLRLQGLGGEGDAGFRVGQDYGELEAELGLTNDDGGWLLLARSSRVQHATGIGLESLTSGAFAARRRAAVRSSDAAAIEDSLPVGHPEGVAVSPVPGHSPSDDRAWSRSIELPRLASEDLGITVEDRPLAPQPVLSGESLSGAASGPAVTDVTDAPTPAYGRPTPMSGVGPRIEAELHIRGWAPPNSEIDLFGYRYRVGPGGAFQLRVEVDDPELLARALYSHPPTELSRQRDD